MALCLPRKRRATSLATRPRTLSVASITNHSCTTSADFALKVLVMSFLFSKRVCRALFHGRRSSDGNLLGGIQLRRGATKALRSRTLYKNPSSRLKPLSGLVKKYPVNGLSVLDCLDIDCGFPHRQQDGQIAVSGTPDEHTLIA